MRRVLDSLYAAGGYLAAAFMVSILAMVLLQVGGGLFNFYVRGTDAYAGYSLAAASFLALADTLRHGEHIRVTLILDAVPGRWRRWLELWCLAVGTTLAGAFAWYAWTMVRWSWRFNDVSGADDGTPLWLPQIGMALGGTLLAVAFLDLLIAALAGHPPDRRGRSAATEDARASEPAHSK